MIYVRWRDSIRRPEFWAIDQGFYQLLGRLYIAQTSELAQWRADIAALAAGFGRTRRRPSRPAHR